MHSISSELLAAQQQPSARPYVSAILRDYDGDLPRRRYPRYYTGAEGEYYVAACTAGDGALVRARIDPATKVLYTQRVASPGSGSSYSAWTSHGTVSASGAVALCADATNVSLFYVDGDTLTVRVKQSTDHGATYGSPATVATAASAVTYLAAAPGLLGSAGQIVLFWTVGSTVWRSRNSAGAWGSATAWTNSAASLTGIACTYGLDWEVVVCGTQTATGDAKVWTCVFGDGSVAAPNAWSSLVELQTATAGSGVSFQAPAVVRADSFRLFFVEKYSGTQAYTRLNWTAMDFIETFASSAWREPAPFDYTGEYGIAAAYGGNVLWLSAAAGVWAGSVDTTPLDVSDDVVDVQVHIEAHEGKARLSLRNDPTTGAAGRYAGYGSGALANLRRGARLDLAPGYYTAAGPQHSDGDCFVVDAIEQTTGPEARLIVHASNGWTRLERWRARRQYTWAAGSASVQSLLSFVCSRAGVGFSTVAGSSEVFSLMPAFTVSPGESARTAVLHLAALIPDRLYFRGFVLTTRQIAAGDAAGYTYGAGHVIALARYLDDGPPFNRARAQGSSVSGDALDLVEIEASGERIAQVTDRNLTSGVEAAGRAATALRDAVLAAGHDELQLATVNTAQELLDAVAVTDPQAGLVAVKRRVRALSWRYTPSGSRPRYDMTLILGQP